MANWIGCFDGSSTKDTIGCGAVLYKDTKIVAHASYLFPRDHFIKETNGKGTCNEAEYMGLIYLIEISRRFDFRTLIIRGDSKLVINQMQGKWKIKARNLITFWREAKLISNHLKNIYEWVPREYNQVADKLSKGLSI